MTQSHFKMKTHCHDNLFVTSCRELLALGQEDPLAPSNVTDARANTSSKAKQAAILAGKAKPSCPANPKARQVVLYVHNLSVQARERLGQQG